MEYLKKEETDPRRHKARCIYNMSGICKQGRLRCYDRRCTGSAHCVYYAETEAQSELIEAGNNNIYVSKPSDLFWGKPILNATEGEEERKVNNRIPRCPVFYGVESIKVRSIKTPSEYKQWKPDPEEERRVVEYYHHNNKPDKPIVVAVINDKYVLKDNFVQYYVAVKLKKTRINATMNLKIPVRVIDKRKRKKKKYR